MFVRKEDKLIVGDTRELNMQHGASNALNVAAAVSVIAVFGISLGLTVPVIALVLAGEGYSSAAIGAHVSAQFLGLMLVSPLTPRLLVRFGTSNLMIFGLLFIALLLSFFAFFHGFLAWLVLRFGLGALEANNWYICCGYIRWIWIRTISVGIHRYQWNKTVPSWCCHHPDDHSHTDVDLWTTSISNTNRQPFAFSISHESSCPHPLYNAVWDFIRIRLWSSSHLRVVAWTYSRLFRATSGFLHTWWCLFPIAAWSHGRPNESRSSLISCGFYFSLGTAARDHFLAYINRTTFIDFLIGRSNWELLDYSSYVVWRHLSGDRFSVSQFHLCNPLRAR